MLIDSHCHLQFNGYNNNRKEVIKRCLAKDMLLNIIGTQKETSKKAVELAEIQKNFYATIGLHPIHLHPTYVDEEESKFLTREEEFDKNYYRDLAKSKKVIAIGECGIDLFHIPKDLDVEKVIKKQKQEFIKQIELAQELNLALVVHIRNSDDNKLSNAYDEALSVIENMTKRSKEIASSQASRNNMCGVIHCYGGTPKQAQKFLDLGFYLGFTGIITFPARKTNPEATEDLLKTIEITPLNKILIETDSPYLAPQKYRGKQCEPWMSEEVAQKIAEIKKIKIEEVLKTTHNNFRKIFKIT